MIALWVGLGAAIGAPLRYLTDQMMHRRLPSRWPVGTLGVNLAAALVLGAVAGVGDAGPVTTALIGTGFCGALSTWSTFAYEVDGLAGLRERAVAAGYLAVSVAGGIGLAALGYALA